MSWKPEFYIKSEDHWYQNGQNFATEEEARKSAYNRFCNWYVPSDYRAVEVDTETHPVNYKWVEGVGDVMLED